MISTQLTNSQQAAISSSEALVLESMARFHEEADGLSEFQVSQRMEGLVEDLARVRDRLDTEAWKAFSQSIRDDVFRARLLEDPFTGRCASKPRGYAGDAVMLDFIYKHPSITSTVSSTTDFGRRVNSFTSDGRASRSVRNRRDLLATEIDRVCFSRPGARLLSVACGHLREGAMSQALRQRQLDEFVALDADVATIESLRGDFGGYPVRPLLGSVKTLLKSAANGLGSFDFIYSAGLYDYLSDSLSIRLTEALTSLLRPGGKLWISNFAPNLRDIGYMEAVMDWWLIYRDKEQLESLASRASLPSNASFYTFCEFEQNVAFLEIAKP